LGLVGVDVPNFVRDFLERNPDLARYPVQRARFGLHFQVGPKERQAVFTGAPMHFWDDVEGWLPLDTEPVYDAGKGLYYVRGVDVTVADDGTVRVGKYSQRTTRVGMFRPATSSLLSAVSTPLGGKDVDSLKASGDIWTIERRITETGYREELTLFEQPNIAAQKGDYFVLETQVSGVSLPDGWLTDEYKLDAYWSPAPFAYDADGNPLECKRYWRNGVLYTGIPAEELAKAKYPVVIDPDFTGLTADGHIYGQNATYSTARSTSTSYSATSTGINVGQYLFGTHNVIRGFLKFDTSGIGSSSTVTQVNLKLTVKSDYSYTDFDVNIIKQNWSAQDPLSDSNREAAYDNVLSSPEDDSIWLNTAGIVTSTQYTSGNLSTAWVNKTGYTYYSLASNRDYDGSGTAPTSHEDIYVYSANDATASYRPVLTVEIGRAHV
jgi:hypothetical protein